MPSQPKPSRSSSRRNLALAGAALLLTLGGLEAVFRRVYDPEHELSAKKIYQVQESVRYADPKSTWAPVGDFVFRDEPIAPEILADDVYRVLFLGDSFTAGAGIPKRQDRFSDRVETSLAAAPPEGRADVHVFNAARGGSMPRDWARYFAAIAPVYRPDAVFAVFFLRDGTTLELSVHRNQEVIAPIRRRWFGMPAARASSLLRFFYNRMAWREFSDQMQSRLEAAYLGSEREQAEWRVQRRFLLEIADACRELGIPFHLVIFPILSELDDYRFGAVEDAIAGFAREHGIPVFSLTPAFLGRDARSLWVAHNNQHPNEEGHRIAGDMLLPYVEEQIPASGTR